MNDDTVAFRESLLKLTIRHAYDNVPLYRNLWSGIDVDSIALKNLHELPLLTKSASRSAGAGALSSSNSTSYLQYTSGSTGSALLLHRSTTEVQSIGEFFRRARPINQDASQPIIMSLANVTHGTATPMPSSAFVINAACIDASTCRSARALLSERFDFPGFDEHVSVVSGPLEQVMYFTEYLRLAGDIPSPRIKLICVYSNHLSKPYFEFLRTHWGVPIADYYSLTEIFGGARSLNRSPFTFDVHVIPEIIRPDGLPTRDGEIGRLVLTSLYPFVQRQPFVRYETRDLASVVSDGDGHPKYRIHGRADNCLLHPDQPEVPILTADDLWDVLDSYPQIWGHTYLSDVPITNRGVFKKSRFRGTCERMNAGQFNIRLELEVAADYRAAANNSLARKLERDICAASAFLNSHITSDLISLRVVLLPPGTISDLPTEKLDAWSHL